MTESCRLVTTEQYKEYKELKEQCNHWHKEAERISHEAIGARLETITLIKKLTIAVITLKEYAELDIVGEEARQALKEIEEVK